MNTIRLIHYPSLKSLLIGAGIVWGLSNINLVSAGTIAPSPLFITTSLDPNIMFILDDSGSMVWSYLPDNTNALKNTKRGKSSTINGAYYDPTITYTPPSDKDGVSLGNASFTNAWKDGYVLLPGHTVNSTANPTVDLSITFRPTWNNATDYADTVVPGPSNTAGSAAYYYQYSPPQTGCAAPGNINNDSCYVKASPSTAAEKQNFANWYSYYRTRLMMAKAGVSSAFAKLGPTPRVGYGRIHKSAATIDGIKIDTIERGVRPFAGTDRAAFFDWLFARTAANNTPLRRALDSAGVYYSNEMDYGPWSTTPGTSGGELLACRQSYTVLMTDGYWNDAAASTVAAQKNIDGNDGLLITGPGNLSFTYKAVQPFKDAVSNSLADVAMYYWNRDLCPSIANKVPTSTLDPAFWQHMVDYGIGLGVPTTVNPTTAFNAISTNATITWPDPNTANPSTTSNARIDDLLHAAVNSRGGFFNAKNPAEFTSALTSTLAKIINSDASSSAAVAANSTQLKTGTQVYQALFSPKDWSGDLLAYDVDAGTPASVGPPPTAAIPATGALTLVWKASSFPPDSVTRNVYTYNPSVTTGSNGVAFQWANLSTIPTGTSQQDFLNTLAGVKDSNGALRVNWIRGDTSNEKISDADTLIYPTHIFRKRNIFLGDIVNSDPIYVGTEDRGYSALPGAEGTNYASFRTQSTYTNRKPMLYVGANDGMLHGFDASTSTGGNEILAYVPNAIFPELSKLTSPNYVHQYYVDGQSNVNDVYDGSNWHTVLAGTTGAGGRAVFGLDVTIPEQFKATNVLWEFSNTNNVDLGYTLAQPSVVRLQDGHYAVIVANGYNSDNGHAVLFVLDALTGNLLQKIDTGAGTAINKNGLSSPLAIDTNNDRSVDTVYAGDLYGNLWKFDLSGNAGSWPRPASPFFIACTTTGVTCNAADRQPITAKPNIGSVGAASTDQNGVGRMIYFGTGKYFETGDNLVFSPIQTQTFYGLWDTGEAITDRVQLQEQTIDFDGIATTLGKTLTIKPIRVVSNNSVCYAVSSPGCNSNSILKKGWALNLLKPVNTAKGERAVSFPLIRRGLVVFSTIIPDPDPCTGGGKSRTMEIDALKGSEPASAPFDINGNIRIDSNDKVIINGVAHVASGIDLEIGITKTPAVVESSDVDFKYLSGSSGAMGIIFDPGAGAPPSGPSSGNRRSWRQLK